MIYSALAASLSLLYRTKKTPVRGVCILRVLRPVRCTGGGVEGAIGTGNLCCTQYATGRLYR